MPKGTKRAARPDPEPEEPIEDPDVGAADEFSDDEVDIVAGEEISFTQDKPETNGIEAEDDDKDYGGSKYAIALQIDDNTMDEYSTSDRTTYTFAEGPKKTPILKGMGTFATMAANLHGAGNMDPDAYFQKPFGANPKFEIVVVTREEMINSKGDGKLPEQKVSGVPEMMKQTTLDWLNCFNDQLYPWLLKKTAKNKAIQNQFAGFKQEIEDLGLDDQKKIDAQLELRKKNYFLTNFPVFDPQDPSRNAKLRSKETIKQFAERVSLKINVSGYATKKPKFDNQKEQVGELKKLNPFKDSKSEIPVEGEFYMDAIVRVHGMIPYETTYLKWDGKPYKKAEASETGEVVYSPNKPFVGKGSIVEPMISFGVSIENNGTVRYQWSFQRWNAPTVTVLQREKPYEKSADAQSSPTKPICKVSKRARFAAAAE